ncbi:transporter substrate-binding domain-containing protein [Lacticaseibacillus porcinae]|uniref:transporter substrate-binding domain-containing protein n=1 Tax=Lacticaseibacillus porcinae TaxID=1123687 RepID=UPI000F7AF62F|nr:transporter substrate-binding domain-containing protein [Lacticaseibacillus porcinae]
MKWQTMRKALLGAALTASIALLAACGNSASNKTTGTFKDDLVTKDTLTIGLEGTYKPYSYRQNNKLVGFEVDLGKAVAKQMGVKAEFKPTKWDSLIAGLGAGKFDLVLNNITQSPERAKSYLFSDVYTYSHYVLISPTSKPITKIADIKGKKLGESTGSDNAIVAKKYGATVVPVENFTTDLQMIKDGRIDANINAAPSWYAYKADHATDGLTMTELPSSEVPPAKVSGLLNKKSTKLQKRVNKALKVLRQNGTLKQLSMKYFGADITK